MELFFVKPFSLLFVRPMMDLIHFEKIQPFFYLIPFLFRLMALQGSTTQDRQSTCLVWCSQKSVGLVIKKVLCSIRVRAALFYFLFSFQEPESHSEMSKNDPIFRLSNVGISSRLSISPKVYFSDYYDFRMFKFPNIKFSESSDFRLFSSRITASSDCWRARLSETSLFHRDF